MPSCSLPFFSPALVTRYRSLAPLRVSYVAPFHRLYSRFPKSLLQRQGTKLRSRREWRRRESSDMDCSRTAANERERVSQSKRTLRVSERVSNTLRYRSCVPGGNGADGSRATWTVAAPRRTSGSE